MKNSIIIGIVIFIAVLGLSTLSKKSTINQAGYGSESDVPAAVAQIKDNQQYVEITLNDYGYTPIVVQKDIPVVFNIKVDDISKYGCTNAIRIPDLKIEQDLKTGDNLVEFTPIKVGDMAYSCWMGMVSSNIKVVEDLATYKK